MLNPSATSTETYKDSSEQARGGEAIEMTHAPAEGVHLVFFSRSAAP